MSKVVPFKTTTLEEDIKAIIYRNLEMSQGKDRSYFDVVRGVPSQHSELANTIINRLISEGAMTRKTKPVFLPGNRSQQLTYYRAVFPLMTNRVD